MNVRELLTHLAPTLNLHEFTTKQQDGYNCNLKISVEHNHFFHAVGEFTREKHIFSDDSYFILQPFEHSYYHGCISDKNYEKCVLDMEVYRWKLEENVNNDKLWHLNIETKQDTIHDIKENIIMGDIL